MKNRRWLIDVALILSVLILGVLVVLRLTGYTSSGVKSAQPTEAQPSTETAEAAVENEAPTAEPEVLSVEGETFTNVNYAADFTLTDLEGNAVSLSDYRGIPVLVNFWATWCPPCRSELPLIQDYQDKYADEFVVLALSGGETMQDVQAFIDAQGYTFKVLLDSEFAAAELYGVRGFPTSYFIDADGAVQKIHIGELTEVMIVAYLDLIGVSE